MAPRKANIKMLWHDVKATSGFRKFLTYLVFVAIAALFWFILTLNDSMQDDIDVHLNVFNVPDTVTFITDPPKDIHVMVRDKGTNLWRTGIIGRATIDLNFREYGQDGVFYVSMGEMTAALKKTFGQTASIISTSADSLRLIYTTLPGRRIPVEVSADLSAAVGKIISGRAVATPSAVTVYSTRETLDTITRVITERLTVKDLEESKSFTVRIKKIPGVRIEPEEVKVSVTVEPLVRKQVSVNIMIDNVPPGEDLLLFPSKTEVEYYLPMSKFNQDDDLIEVHVDYRDLESGSNRLPLHLGRHNPSLENIRILDQSVEYTLVRD
ncbi:MAG: hypothetical protein K2I48_01925 [Muribaculaceae bacterium]|nr:hypothetical protein [Muribaculaceae bacterium]